MNCLTFTELLIFRKILRLQSKTKKMSHQKFKNYIAACSVHINRTLKSFIKLK